MNRVVIMSEKKKPNKSNDSMETWLDEHNLDEIVETTNLDILPKYDIIPKDDLITIRKVVISGIPKRVDVVKDGSNLSLDFLSITDSGVKYSLPFNSKALQRSYISLAIKECKAKDKTEIDFSKIIGKMYGLKREQFTAKGFTQAPLKFFRLEK